MLETILIWILRLFGYDIVKTVHTHEQAKKEQSAADSANLTRPELENDLEKANL
jgi:hypothetical protein